MMTLTTDGVAVAHRSKSHVCSVWVARVTEGEQHGKAGSVSLEFPSLVDPDPWRVASMSDEDKIRAISCLMALENDEDAASFGGAIRLNVSQTFAPARVSSGHQKWN